MKLRVDNEFLASKVEKNAFLRYFLQPGQMIENIEKFTVF